LGGGEEREAVARLRRGEIGGLETLVRRHHLRAVRAAYLMVGDRGLAEEIVQSAFVKAYERIGSFDPARPFGPWFSRIVINDSITAASRARKSVSLDELGESTGVADPEPGPQERAERSDEDRRVRQALEDLPPAQRGAVVQRYFLGMSEAEMAQHEGAPPGTIKSRLHAARRSLSRLLGPRPTAESTVERPARSPREAKDAR
jgi:RNA polymerase sigma-70 factor, ECF subfamily